MSIGFVWIIASTINGPTHFSLVGSCRLIDGYRCWDLEKAVHFYGWTQEIDVLLASAIE